MYRSGYYPRKQLYKKEDELLTKELENADLGKFMKLMKSALFPQKKVKKNPRKLTNKLFLGSL
jgi:hypothetical protein